MREFPTIIDLELSNRCNLSCVMCPRLPQEANSGNMSRALLDKILDEALQVPRRAFRLHGMGEPLLSPLFEHAVQRIKGHDGGHAIGLSTNGHLLTRERARFIIKHYVDVITISVAAASAEAYQAVRRSSHFDRVVRNTIALLDERSRRNAPVDIWVQLVTVQPAAQEVEAFIDFWSRFDVQITVWDDFNMGRLAHNPVPPITAPCGQLREYTLITWEGRMGMCCIDSERNYMVGDVTKQSLAAAYNGEKLQAIRQLHRAGTEGGSMPICALCSYRDNLHVRYSDNPWRRAQPQRGAGLARRG